ncbi:heat shock protein HtpX [Anaerolineae bacterium]|nr:heat shock protein HtpX [Anaerolineae bacterium]
MNNKIMEGSENLTKTVILLGALTGLMVAIGYFLGGSSGMIIALIMAAVTNLSAWWFSDSIALSSNGAQPVEESQAPELHQMIETLATRANLPKPKVYVINTAMPNAFATGRSPDKGAVAVTTGIMQTLTTEELAGVIAHELAHIKHRDTLIASVAATVAGAITTLANMAQWSLLSGGMSRSRYSGDRDNQSGGAAALQMIGGILMVFLAPLAATLIQMAISRAREFSADAGGAQILGNPVPLASALQKLEAAAGQAPARINPASSHLYIVNPLHAGALAGLFRTHPPTEERIKRLMAMAGQ